MTEVNQEDVIQVSNVLNDTGAYNKMGIALGIEIDCDSQIFQEIEEFIVEKFNEMQEENLSNQ